MSLVVDEHREYLADPVRVGAFDAALRAMVRPGSIVLDLASGTGILGLLGLRAGAAHVYAIESEPIAGLAGRIARDVGALPPHQPGADSRPRRPHRARQRPRRPHHHPADPVHPRHAPRTGR